jgi:hypothetical protein
MSDHKRNTGPMLSSPRCGAKTRGGGLCKAPAVRDKRRCRMHGGAAGSGAPFGNKNAQKSGFYTRKAMNERGWARALARHSQKTLGKTK